MSDEAQTMTARLVISEVVVGAAFASPEHCERADRKADEILAALDAAGWAVVPKEHLRGVVLMIYEDRSSDQRPARVLANIIAAARPR